MRHFRLFLGLLISAGAVALAIIAGGWVPIMLGLIAAFIVADALVPDFHTPVVGNLADDIRRRLGRR
jgi:hypothetical protein